MGADYTFLAIYFRMGQYNKDDKVPSRLIGFDCPFDNSPVLYAGNEAELERKIRKIYDSGDFTGEGDLERDWDSVDWEGLYPDVICDDKGKIQVDLYRRITSEENFHPDTIRYSFGRETLTALWEREKWRWIQDQK